MTTTINQTALAETGTQFTGSSLVYRYAHGMVYSSGIKGLVNALQTRCLIQEISSIVEPFRKCMDFLCADINNNAQGELCVKITDVQWQPLIETILPLTHQQIDTAMLTDVDVAKRMRIFLVRFTPLGKFHLLLPSEYPHAAKEAAFFRYNSNYLLTTTTKDEVLSR